jgi:hypothetical protein
VRYFTNKSIYKPSWSGAKVIFLVFMEKMGENGCGIEPFCKRVLRPPTPKTVKKYASVTLFLILTEVAPE